VFFSPGYRVLATGYCRRRWRRRSVCFRCRSAIRTRWHGLCIGYYRHTCRKLVWRQESRPGGSGKGPPGACINKRGRQMTLRRAAVGIMPAGDVPDRDWCNQSLPRKHDGADRRRRCRACSQRVCVRVFTRFCPRRRVILPAPVEETRPAGNIPSGCNF